MTSIAVLVPGFALALETSSVVFPHLVAAVAVGGQWPGNPDATTVFPQFMRVDYVRVYERIP
jgi:hypothetical protein